MRKHFLVKPKIQLLHLALTLGALAMSVVIGYMFVESTLSSTLAQAISPEQWAKLQHDLRLGFSVVFVIVLCAIGIEHLLFFHSIVGPLYALENALKRMLNGQYDDPVRIRESDQLKELIESFEMLRKKIKAEAEKKAK